MTASGFRPGGDSVHPISPVENENDHKFKPLTPDSEQLAWLAARATGAAPTYFRPCGRFLDGGLISNNPTLDLLTELQEMNMAQRLQNKRVTPLSVVVSLGTGRMPVEPIETVDVFRPQSLMETFRSAMGFSSLGRIVVEVATMSEGPVVDRASAWCASLGVPFFRFSPCLSLHVTLDTTDTKELLQMVWETEAYLYRARCRLNQLASML
ncbi:Calcium-independent phospholipase A2 [Paragonimus heterotremus]|uniref:Calcium-independent phospholipase A2 n=1 Tax=Paragonimus heterotremus TaxID=100268 RepID=A0A8J4SZE7_9TREM|nr:Calcium-independent phospholipase A2 [Paragonimus heterotremus]